MVWAVVGMALFRNQPMSRIVNQLDILLPGDRPFIAPSAIPQARQRLGEDAIREVFNQTQALWHQHTPIQTGVDGGFSGWTVSSGVRPIPPKTALHLHAHVTVVQTRNTLRYA